MKDAVILLLCAVALAHGFNENPNQRSRPCNCNPSEAQQICLINYDNDDVLIAHENCDKFYKCTNGIPVAYRCPNNLLYDPYTETCEWSDSVECGDRPISEGIDNDNDTDNDISDEDDDNVPGTCNCNPSEASSICAAKDSNGILVAHQNCNQFYMCAEGNPVTFTCSPALLYNPYREECDWAVNVKCGDRVIPVPGDDDDNNSGNDDSKEDGTCNCNPEEAPAICGAPDSESVLIAHENCNKYYICDHGTPVAISCSGNLLYNPYTEKCDWPRDVDCGDRIVPENDCIGCNDDTDNDASCDDNDDQAPPPGIVNPEDSESSEIDDHPPGDDDGVPPPPIDEGTCNCNPEEAPSICAGADSSGVLVAHENCNQFYKCDHGKPVVLECLGSLLYNPYTEQCDWPENVNCGDRVIPAPEDTGPGGESNEGPAGGSDEEPEVPGGGGGNCNPEEAPGICAADGSDGVLVAHENCNQFYKCSGGIPVALECQPNLLFNPNTDQCDWPHNVKCGDRVIPETDDSDIDDDRPPGDDDDGIPQPPIDDGTCNCNPEEAPSICADADSSGVLVAHENCNQFYKCDHGKPVALECLGSLLYNPYTEQCDWPENVDCGDRVIPAPEDTGPGGESNEGPGGGSDEEPEVPGGGGGNYNPEEAPGICAADGSDGILVAHENCNQFYKCSGGIPVALECQPNLLFNPNTDQCDWPHNVDCGDRVIPDTDDSDIDDDRPPGDDDDGIPQPPIDDGTCNCNPEEAPSICAGVDSSGVLVAHENCNQFYKCDHGKPVALECLGSLLYNPYTEQCDWPENVDCGDRVIPAPEDTGPGGESNEGPGGGSNEEPEVPGGGGGNCNPEEAPAICAADGSDGVLVAHKNCNQFYKCSGGIPVALECQPNLLFNPNTDQCDWPHNVDCGDRVIPDTDDSDIDDGRPPGDDDDGIPQPPIDDGTCNCNPEEAPSICAGADSSGVLVAHENCNQFYKCDHGKPVALECLGSLLYNPYTEQCDWPENVDCGDRVIPAPEDTGPGGESNEGPGGGSDEEPEVPGGGGGNCNPEEAPGICAADGSDGVLVAHENCNQFYKCSGGIPVALECQPNLLFNPNTDQCDWPHNVDCGDRVIPDTDDSDIDDGRPPGDDDDGIPQPPIDDGTCNCNPEEAPSICAGADSSGVLVAHENCNQFYKCDHGKPVALECLGSLLYNPYTEQCDWPENVDCGDRVIPAPEDTGPGGESNEGPGGGSDEEPEVPGGGGGNCNPEEAPGICAANGSDGVLVAHENCNQFYKCSGGIPVALECQPNLLFNPNTDQCDWPHNVDCGDRVIPDTDDSDIDDGRPPGDDDDGIPQPPIDDGTCNCNPEEAPSICAGADSSGVLVAHENCNQFYKCDHGKPVALECLGSLLYNPYTEQCDWPENVDCGDRVIPAPEDTGPGGESYEGPGGGSDEEPEVPGGGGGNCNPEEAPAICAADGSDGVLVAHKNCNQFYKCSGGIPVALECQPNLLFNPNTDQCDWPHNVDCGDRVIPDTDDSEIDDGRPPGDDDDGIPQPPIDDGTCNCNPEEAPSICAGADSSGVLVAHENCNQFYKCDHGKPVALECLGSLLYNPYTEQCDWPENVDCGDRVIPAPEDTGPGGESNEGLGGGSDEEPEVPGGGGGNCNPEEAPGICAANGSDGVLVAHENCNQFYKCSGGIPVALECQPNLLFNPNTDQCDWPHNVDCGDRVIPDTDDSDIDDGRPPGDDDDGIPQPPIDDGTCNCNPEEAPSICAGADSSGVLVAHENCNQFYKCDHGKPVALECLGSLLYNPYTEQCDWPENVDCGDRVIPAPEDTGPGGESNEGPGGGSDEEPEVPGGGGGNCNPEEAPGICAADGSDGVLVAHENCNQFYKCSGGIPVALECQPNLLFNPNTDQCDWPHNVDCGDRVIPDTDDSDIDDGRPPGDDDDGIPQPPIDDGTCNCNPTEAPSICAGADSSGVLVAHENCNQFYKCDHGKPVALECLGSLLYNPYTEQCDWPENVDCGDRVIPAPEDTGPGGESNEGPGGGSDEEPEVPGGGGGNCNPEEAPGICAADGSDGVLVAHENCNQFYKCSGGIPVALECQPNLLFNPNTDQCDWPHNVDCGDRVIPDTDDSDIDDGRPPGDDDDGIPQPPIDDGTCNCNPEEAPSICAGADSSGVLVAHENCNQFYKCDHGKPVALECLGSLLYNPYTEQCDWPENVDCGDRVIPAPEDTGPGGESNEGPGGGSDEEPEVPGGGGGNCNPEEAPGICAADGSDGVLVAHENCNQFYKCSGGIPVALECQPNLLFNPNTDQCDWPHNVDCGDRVIPAPEDTGPGGQSNEGPGGGSDEEPEVPGGGGGNCNPEEAPGICAADGSDGVLVAHENCNQFYKCSGGIPVALKCQPNLLFNPNTDQCDWPHNVDCGDRVIPDTDDSDIDDGRPPGDDDDGIPQPPIDDGTCNCNPEEAPSICAGADSSGVLVAHENCNQFYKCDHGKPVALECLGSLLYNPYTEQCDWPENVDCGDRVIPAPEDTGPGGESNEGPGGGSDEEPEVPGGGGGNCNPEEAPGICAADGSDGVLVAHENCNQFYKCSGGIPVALECQPNLLFNPNTDQCDWPHNVDCGDRVIPDTDDSEIDDDDPPGDDEGVRPPADDENDSNCSDNNSNDDNSCNCNPDEAPSICAGDHSDGVLIAHEYCNHFYKCDNGNPVPFKCSPNLLYNPHTQECDWPFNVECGDRPIPDPEDNNESESPEDDDNENDNDDVGPCNCNPQEAPAICAVYGSNGVQITHENCNQFYLCDNSRPVAFTCNGFLLYNPYTEQCDWPANVKCDDRVIPEPEEDNDNGSDVDDDNNAVYDDPSQAPLVCAGSGSTGVLVAHESCDQYYICDGGIPISRPCHEGLLFNPQNQRCDWPTNVDCGNRIAPDDCACNPRNAAVLCARPGSDSKLIAHENCDQFYICSNSVPMEQSCPAGTVYNTDKEVCDWPQNVNCNTRTPPHIRTSLNKHWQSRQTLRK